MTCIVGLVDKGTVWMGGDTIGVAGMLGVQRKDTKVFQRSQYLIGFTTSFRMGQILRYEGDLPEPPADISHGWMVTEFIKAIRELLKAGGYAKKDSEVESAGCFLVGVGGRLFQIESDYQVGEPMADFDAVGCGAEIALGALHATHGRRPEERIRVALEAAERFSTGVRGPFTVLSMRGKS